MGYTPPSARMRKIKQAQARIVQKEAEAEAEAGVEKKVVVKVGAMKATVSAGPDGKLGTADDTVKISPAKPKPKAKPAAKPKAKPVPKFDKSMTKDQLLKVAKKMSAEGITPKSTKADILKALKKAAKSWK